ncbi:DnaJ C-terminal domain-containing protein [Cognatiyoonia sp. IB215182]|uniref:DnaJ C-terminal domain-containing protein n=1 Tax=Cognatiyoonia sp. IB215182 TaxID=3097353 RepID=UPI002A0FA38C|nr:DnaJ C-terminal domain-containing protein [Cognatiyoonia sp. IB215182]MDX8354995.1 DnaJ C-terminal domain-containing protein [Cognatiyoonia sp. IB215182]
MVDTALYQALGIPMDASADDIKRAYRKIARKYHPDVNPGPEADAKFKAASAAYDVLRDPEKRAAYDRYGADWDQPRPEGGPTGNTRWRGGFAFDEGDVNADAFRDFFGTAFSERAMRPDQHAAVTITLEDAIAGATRSLTLQSPQIDETGRMTLQTRHIDLSIPKGVLPGQQLRLAGQGGGGADLLIEVSFAPHPVYRVEGRDLYVTLPVTPWEAALGGKVPMPTPAGPVDLTVPANARQGQKLRLQGRGMPTAVPGDLYAVLQIVNPPQLSDAARDLYRQLARTDTFNPRSKLGV